MKPLSDGFVWAHWEKMHVIKFWGWGFEISLRTFDSWSLLEHFLPESPLCFSELSRKTKNMQSASQNETLSVCEQSWLMLNFSHRITAATLSLSFSFFPHSFSCHPSGAFFNLPSHSLSFYCLKLPLFLFLSFCLSSTYSPFIFLSFPLSHRLSFFVILSLFLLSQSLYFYEARDSVLLISIFLRCRTGLVTEVTASRFTAHTQLSCTHTHTHTHTGNKAQINIMLSHRISSPLTKSLSHMHKTKIYSSPVSLGITFILDNNGGHVLHPMPTSGASAGCYVLVL